MEKELKNYIFKTTATMKEYNNKKWYIDPNVVPDFQVQATSVNEALLKYKDFAYEKGIIRISDNAIKTKREMYADTEDDIKQIGYVITGQADFYYENYKWCAKYIDLWVEILTVVDTEF